jgi:hypothetical protein
VKQLGQARITRSSTRRYLNLSLYFQHCSIDLCCIEVEVSLLRSHMRMKSDCIPTSSPRDGEPYVHDIHGLDACSHCSNLPNAACVSDPAVLDSAIFAIRKSGPGREIWNKQASEGSGAVDNDVAALGSNSDGLGVWQAQVVRVYNKWRDRTTRAVNLLRLLDLWQFLRQKAIALKQLVVKAVLRVLQFVRSRSSLAGGPGMGHVRKQQILLMAASIIFIAIQMQSDGTH